MEPRFIPVLQSRGGMQCDHSIRDFLHRGSPPCLVLRGIDGWLCGCTRQEQEWNHKSPHGTDSSRSGRWAKDFPDQMDAEPDDPESTGCEGFKTDSRLTSVSRLCKCVPSEAESRPRGSPDTPSGTRAAHSGYVRHSRLQNGESEPSGRDRGVLRSP